MYKYLFNIKDSKTYGTLHSVDKRVTLEDDSMEAYAEREKNAIRVRTIQKIQKEHDRSELSYQCLREDCVHTKKIDGIIKEMFHCSKTDCIMIPAFKKDYYLLIGRYDFVKCATCEKSCCTLCISKCCK